MANSGEAVRRFCSVVAGETQEFSTGAHRSADKGRGRYDLIPTYPQHRLAVHFENGATVHGERNWEKGIPLRNYLNSAERHMNAFKAGERSEDHLSAILWNIGCYLQTEKWIDEGRLPESLRNGCAWPHSLGEKSE